MAFSKDDGRPYLKHHAAIEAPKASDPCPMEVDEKPAAPITQPMLMLPQRPPSSCASEFAEFAADRERWESHEAAAIQVGA
jgi:hypothetical protein